MISQHNCDELKAVTTDKMTQKEATGTKFQLAQTQEPKK